MITTKIKQGMGAVVLALAMVTVFSCTDFLNQMPKSSLTEEQVFGNLDNIVPAVDGLYTSFRGTKTGREGWSLIMLGLDETKQGIVQISDAEQSGLDYYNGMLNSSSSKVAAMWNRRWPTVIAAANAIYALDIAKASNTDEATLAKIRTLKGDASFIRGMLMFELAMYWGEVPVIDMATMENTKRQPLEKVWEQIFEDFTYASENLPDKQTTDPKRATSGAALAMLGKACMSVPAETGLRDFSKAKDCFEAIKSRYGLDTQYANLFSENLDFNSTESIFELDYSCDWNAPNSWQWDLGSRTIYNSFGEACYFGGFDVTLPTEYCYRMKADGGVWEEGDLRRNVAMRFEYTYLGMTFTVPSWGADELDPHIKKWEDKRVDAIEGTSEAPTRSYYLSGKNCMLIRYADVLLSLAECLNELGQTGEAVNIVNDVRTRAWGGTLPADKRWSSLSQEEFRTQIMDERMRELCFEGWRRIDLIRTGKFVNLIKERNPWAKQAGAIQPYHVRYPIPDTEIRTNPDINPEDQNPGYK
ncbi:membrane protein [Bacteroidia bacterium]|nr:membrane protein [Bacteroidia bacterium]